MEHHWSCAYHTKYFHVVNWSCWHYSVYQILLITGHSYASKNIIWHQKIPLLVGESFSRHGHQLYASDFNVSCLWLVSLVVHQYHPLLMSNLPLRKWKRDWGVSGKFWFFFKTDKELLNWYRVLVSVCELPQNLTQATTINFCNFECLFTHCTDMTV